MDSNLLQSNKSNNAVETVKLVAGMMLLLGFAGYIMGGVWFAVIAVALAWLTVFAGPQMSSQAMLRMYRAQPIPPQSAPYLHEIFNALSRRAELGYVPKLYYIPTRHPNAFATGTRKNAVVAVTDGILRMMSARELAGILAHELSHIRHNDVRLMTLADSFSRLSALIARLGLLTLFIFFPIALFTGSFWFFLRMAVVMLVPGMVTLLQLALSRSREFHADMGACELTHDPEGLATALQKLEKMHPESWLRRILMPGNREPEPATLRTHPHTRDRVERLLKLLPQYANQPPVIAPQASAGLAQPYSVVDRPPRYHFINGLWY